MSSLVSVTNLVGIYTIIGSNQDETDSTYKGTLNLTLDYNNRIIAKWLINNSQKQFGTGFFKSFNTTQSPNEMGLAFEKDVLDSKQLNREISSH